MFITPNARTAGQIYIKFGYYYAFKDALERNKSKSLVFKKI